MKLNHQRRYPIHGTHSRSGAALFVTVMSVALIVSLLGLAGLTVLGIKRQGATAAGDLMLARSNAESALELALRVLDSNANWRTTYSNGVESNKLSLGTGGKGTVSWILEDTDGRLDDADTDLRLKGIGRVGDVVQVASVKIQQKAVQNDYLRCVLHAAGVVSTNNNSTASGGPISSNTNVSISGTFNGNIDAVSYSGTPNGVYTASPTKSLPPASLFDTTYLPMATTIDWNMIPIEQGKETLTGTLSASSNPTGGPTNPNGIYHVTIPAGDWLRTSNLTLNGTLLVTMGTDAKFQVMGGGDWQPHNSQYPLLLVKTVNVGNWVGFFGNATNTHSGLVHIIGSTGNPSIEKYYRLNGTIISETTVQFGSTQTPILTHNPALYNTPPNGYATTDIRGIGIVPGSQRWDPAP